jgi:drug/metabolite transporter (DMT)-like permease
MDVMPNRATSGTRAPTKLAPAEPAAASPLRVWVALGAIYVIWGSTYLAIRETILTIPPLLSASIRFLIAGGILYAITVRQGDRTGDRPTARQWGAATIIGGLLLLGGNGGVVWAEQHVATGVVALIIAMTPIWLAVLDRIVFGRRLPAIAVAGLVLGFGGLILLIGGAGEGRVSVAGITVAILGDLAWAVGSLYARSARLPRRPLVGTGMEMLMGGLLLGVAGLVTGEAAKFHPSQFSAESLLGLAYLIVFGSWIGFVAYVWLLRNAPTSLVSTYAYVNPVIAVFLGWLFLDEVIRARTLAAAGIIVVGVALIIWSRRGPTEPESERSVASTG